MTAINRALKCAIRRCGLTQTMVAHKMNMTGKTFHLKINEKGSCFDVKELRELGRALGLTDEQLLAIVKGRNGEGCS